MDHWQTVSVQAGIHPQSLHHLPVPHEPVLGPLHQALGHHLTGTRYVLLEPLPGVGEVVVVAEEEVWGGEDLLHHLSVLPVGLALGLGQVVLRPREADDLGLHHTPHVPTLRDEIFRTFHH